MYFRHAPVSKITELAEPLRHGEKYVTLGQLYLTPEEKAYLDYHLGTIHLYVTMVSNPEYLNTPEVCRLFNIVPTTLRHWANTGRFPADAFDPDGERLWQAARVYKYLDALSEDGRWLLTQVRAASLRRNRDLRKKEASKNDHEAVTDPEHADGEPQDSPESGSV